MSVEVQLGVFDEDPSLGLVLPPSAITAVAAPAVAITAETFTTRPPSRTFWVNASIHRYRYGPDGIEVPGTELGDLGIEGQRDGLVSVGLVHDQVVDPGPVEQVMGVLTPSAPAFP